MKKIKLITFLLLLTLMISTCASSGNTLISKEGVGARTIEDIDCCDDFKKQATALEPEKEIFILVHGCKASSGNFNILKQVFESRGQQAVCFSYDYRDLIERCSDRLVTAISILDEFFDPPRITIIAHSQGSLVARRAIIEDRVSGLTVNSIKSDIRLVSISGPYNGIAASAHCGIPALHVVTVGITALICEGIAGSNWVEINPSSDFIKNPGQLSDKVLQHLKINTDERGTCRTLDEEGNCIKSDYVFSLDEQYIDAVDKDKRVLNVDLKAGHAQVVGTPGQPPYDLIQILEQYDVLDERSSLTLNEEKALFTKLYSIAQN